LLNILTAQSREPIITVLPALKEQVNAETENNGIPWFRTQEKFDIELAGKLLAETTLVKTIKGDFSYTLYKFSYKVEKVILGKFSKKILTFFIERPFPAPGSHLVFKELWPFNKDKLLTFKLRKGEQRYLIVSIE
jgi:hypothetical protein